MPSEKDNILKFNQYMKSDKMLYIIYADLESLIKKIDECANNPENFSTTKLREYISYRYSMSTIWAFDNIENKHTLYCGEDCMKKICDSLGEHAAYVISFKKKKMLQLPKKELKLHQYATECHICGKRFLKMVANCENYLKVRDHCDLTE